MVRTHPETGERSLFVNPLFTDKIDGLRRHESDMVLGLLHEAAVAPERLVRWRWETGDVAFWDNRCTMHYALARLRNRSKAHAPSGPRGGQARRGVELLRGGTGGHDRSGATSPVGEDALEPQFGLARRNGSAALLGAVPRSMTKVIVLPVTVPFIVSTPTGDVTVPENAPLDTFSFVTWRVAT